MADTFETVATRLSENETTLGRLYELFATAFSVDGDLWRNLAREEEEHADWIRQALEGIPPEARQRPIPTVRLQAVTSMIQYVTSVAERCRRGELTRLTALALARDLENSLLEGKLLDTLTTGPSALTGAHSALVDATVEHRKRIADALQKLRR